MTPLVICLIICALTMVSYVLNKIPMALTALLSMVAFILTGCLNPQTALGYFGNANGIMIVAMFVVAAGFTRTQFVKKAAASVNKIAHGSLMMVMLGYVLVTALLAQFIQSSIIVFGIMAPMMIASCEELKISPSKTLFPLCIVSIATISALPLGGGATRYATLNGYLQANDYASYTVAITASSLPPSLPPTPRWFRPAKSRAARTTKSPCPPLRSGPATSSSSSLPPP